ncbi:MAG: PRC-barrel domain-containing protein [Candidatus Cryptobacteroides sp.]|nr:PRC-barrel domain-containing protein [Candidatus Cryptobacteroides sp.]
MLRVAQVLKSNGTDGELLLSFFDVAPEDIDLQEPVFIEFDGLPVPFYFESFTPRGNNRALVRLTGVRSLKDADELAGQSVYADYFEEEEEEDLVGWTLCNADGQAVGTVVDYEDIPGNLCLWVERPDGEQILIPFHEDLILSMEESTQTITMSIPEGILDLE